MRRNILSRVIAAADLEADLTPGIPVVELVGNSRILIENHLSVLCYEKEKICVKMKYGYLRICGNELVIGRMAKCQLVIMGEVQSIQLLQEGDRYDI